MRICLLSQEYFQTLAFGGTGSYVKNLSKGLAKLGCEVHMVTIAAEGMQSVFYETENICIHAVHCPEWSMTYQYLIFGRKARKIVRDLCKSNKIDIVHGNMPLLPDYAISKRDVFGKSIIDSVHGTYLKEREYILDEPLSSLKPREILLKYIPSLYVSKEKDTMQRADRLIAVSNLKREVTQLYDIAEDKIAVVNYGIDTSFFSPTRKFEEVGSKYMVGDSKLILYMGRFYPKRKGLLYLLQAMPNPILQNSKHSKHQNQKLLCQKTLLNS